MRHIWSWTYRYKILWTFILATVLWTGPAAFAQCVPPAIGAAFVAATDFGTGSYSTINLDTLEVCEDIVPLGINSDAIVRYDSGTNLLYVVNRFGADSIQVIDPKQGYITPNGFELSVENGANPHDIALISPLKAYVSRAARAELLIINPSTLTITGAIDLSSHIKSNDIDGSPEPFRMLVLGTTVYLILQHLDRQQELQPPLAPGEIVVIDSNTDTVTTVIPLATQNPFSDLQYTAALARGPRILVSSVNDFGMLDGGIEAIDPATNTRDMGFILEESAVNGNITFFEVVSEMLAYAIVGLLDGSFTNALVQFNPSTGQMTSTLATGLPFTLNFAINNDGELFIAPVDIDAMPPEPGARIFNTVTAQEITVDPIRVGNLPGGWITMVEERQVALTVHRTGTGAGMVSSVPAGLCDPVCTRNFQVNTAVVLTATPNAGSSFGGWPGNACMVTPTGECVVVMDQEKAVTAEFNSP